MTTSIVNSPEAQASISAVLVPGADLESAVLDLTAVLSGLVGDRFEILLVCASDPPSQVADLLARAPQLPMRVVRGGTLADGCAAARYELVFVAARDGQFDVRELNHLLDAVELGADVAVGYRPRRADALMRQLQKWGWRLDLDCAFSLVRRRVWDSLTPNTCWAELAQAARRAGYSVTEVPVSHKRPALGTPLTGRLVTG